MMIPIRKVIYEGGIYYRQLFFDVQTKKMIKAKLMSKEWYDLLSYLSDDVLSSDMTTCTYVLSLPIDIHHCGNTTMKVVDMINMFIQQDYPDRRTCDDEELALIALIQYCASHSIQTYTSYTMNDMEMFHESLKYT